MEEFSQDIELKNVKGLYDDLEQKSTALEIADLTTQSNGSDWRAEALRIIKVIEARRKFFTEPQNIILKQINESARSAKVPFENIANGLKTKLLDYDEKLLEQKRIADAKEKARLDKIAEKEAEERRRIEAEAAEKERIAREEFVKKEEEKERIAKEEAMKTGQEFVPPDMDEYIPPPPPPVPAPSPPPVPLAPPSQMPKKIKTERSTSSTTDRWKAEVVDEKTFMKWCVDHDEFSYLKIDLSALNKLAKIKKGSWHPDGVTFWNDKGLSTRS